MTVELDHTKPTRAAGRAETLASSIRTQAAAARSASPIALPSLDGLIDAFKGLLKMKQMSQGVAPVFQMSFGGQKLYQQMMSKDGRSAEWATWFWSGGGKHQGPPTSLFRAPELVTGARTGTARMPTGGWADPLAKGGGRGRGQWGRHHRTDVRRRREGLQGLGQGHPVVNA